MSSGRGAPSAAIQLEPLPSRFSRNALALMSAEMNGAERSILPPAPAADVDAVREEVAPSLPSETRRDWRATVDEGALSDRPTAEGGLIPPGRAIVDARGEAGGAATAEPEPPPIPAGLGEAVLARTPAATARGAAAAGAGAAAEAGAGAAVARAAACACALAASMIGIAVFFEAVFSWLVCSMTCLYPARMMMNGKQATEALRTAASLSSRH